MFQAMIYNNDVETTIHYPSSNKEDPHVDSLQLKEDTAGVGTLIFKLYPNNKGYNLIEEFKTYIKVKDLRDNSIRFSGRIIKIEDKMDSGGQIYKDVTCENALGFLNDTKERCSSYYGNNGSSFLTQILNTHNNKVNDEHKKIYLGNCDINKSITHTCDFKTALAEILQTVEDYGGYIRIREVDNKRYLDWLTKLENDIIQVDLGINMKEIVKSNNIFDIGTRIIPLGANHLTIESVNGGKDYIDDPDAISKYGIIEKTVEYSDIENASELKTKCMNELHNYTKAEYILSTSAIDLSYKTGISKDRYKLGSPLHIRNRFMQIDDTYIVNSISLDLLTPYNPTLEISKRKTSLSQTINDIRSETISNNGVYNNVQIGSAYGIRAVRSDGKVVTTMNATEGISIKNRNDKVFYVDTNGNLVAVNIKAEGGEFDQIEVIDSTLTNIDVSKGTFKEIEICDGLRIISDDKVYSFDNDGIHLEKDNDKVTLALTYNSSASGEEKLGLNVDKWIHTDKGIRCDTLISDVKIVSEGPIYANDNIVEDGTIYVKNGRSIQINHVSLENYINKLIREYSEDKGWE